jgi:hypothetical protein
MAASNRSHHDLGTLALVLLAPPSPAPFYVNWVEQPARLKLDVALLCGDK